MKSICAHSIFVFLLFGVSIHPQRLTQAASETATWKEYAAEDGSFKILFPKPPVKNPPYLKELLRKKDDASNNFKFYVSDVSLTESYSVSYSDFPAPILDQMEREATYQVATNSGENAKPVVSQGLSGVEFAVDDETQKLTLTRRFFIVGQRFFQLSAATPLLSRLPLSKRQSYQRKIRVFFNSFVIGKIPPAEYQPTPDLAKDFGSSVKGQIYFSDYLSLKMTLPPNWTFNYVEGIKEMTPAEKREHEKMSVTVRWLRKNNATLFSALKEPDKPGESAELSVRVSRVRFANVSLREFAESEKDFETAFFMKLVEPIKSANVNGHEFLTFGVEESEPHGREANALSAKVRIYVTNRKGVFLVIRLIYREEADEKLMTESLKTLTYLN